MHIKSSTSRAEEPPQSHSCVRACIILDDGAAAVSIVASLGYSNNGIMITPARQPVTWGNTLTRNKTTTWSGLKDLAQDLAQEKHAGDDGDSAETRDPRGRAKERMLTLRASRLYDVSLNDS